MKNKDAYLYPTDVPGANNFSLKYCFSDFITHNVLIRFTGQNIIHVSEENDKDRQENFSW